MHSLHANPLSAMQEIGSPAKSEPTSPAHRAGSGSAGTALGAPFRIVHEYQPPGLAPE